jgi:hypothetical protein
MIDASRCTQDMSGIIDRGPWIWALEWAALSMADMSLYVACNDEKPMEKHANLIGFHVFFSIEVGVV